MTHPICRYTEGGVHWYGHEQELIDSFNISPEKIEHFVCLTLDEAKTLLEFFGGVVERTNELELIVKLLSREIK